jgi:glycosyltransferase involved in cell wall biosynthesis
VKLYYIANARMPTEKAHGIQIAKMCEAFIEAGADLTLVVPRRATDSRSLKDYYGLRVHIPLIRLPALDWYTGGRIGYFLSSFSFMLSYLVFVFKKKVSGEKFILYTVDTDNFSSSALALTGLPFFSEMHGAKPPTLAQKALFKKASGIMAINNIIIEELKQTFPNSQARYLREPNGVDLSEFTGVDKQDARRKLELPADVPIVLYTGRFFEWKGLEILPKAARLSSNIRWQVVGGIKEDFGRLIKEPLPDNLFFAGSRPHSEMALWLAAADALLVLGTVRDIQSYRYTSPMKLFEYLAALRPIIASKTPAICEAVSEKEVLFYTPDDVADLALKAGYAAMHHTELEHMIAAAKNKALTSSWSARAERILQFIEVTIRKHKHA